MLYRLLVALLMLVSGSLFIKTGFLGKACAQKSSSKECSQKRDNYPASSFAGTAHSNKEDAFFSKGLEHDLATGLLTKKGRENYKKLVKALTRGEPADFKAVSYAGFLRFANPQGAFLDKETPYTVPPFPKLSSPEAAALLLEIYCKALCRDIPFHAYGTGKGADSYGSGRSLTSDSAAYLQALGPAYKGPRTPQGTVDASVLFRSFPKGSLIGPYISQFLLLPLNTLLYGTFPSQLDLFSLCKTPFILQEQTRPIATAYKDFALSFSDFVTLQNGTIPVPYSPSDYASSARRFITTGRDLASCVHFDHPYEPFYNALAILFERGFPSLKEPFYSLVWTLVAGVSFEALKAAWIQKWRVFRVLRPEAFAGLVHLSMATHTNPFNLHPSLFTAHAGLDMLALTKDYNKRQGAATYLLSQAYPEGSPLHPSYPQAHTTIGGACVTIIKAFFDNDAAIASYSVPMKPDPQNPSTLIPLKNEGEKIMTVGSELDKLVCNLGAGRNFAGIHYRTDLEEGLRLGEQVALSYLQSHGIPKVGPSFKGFTLTTFDGVKIRVTSKSIKKVCDDGTKPC